MRYRWAGCHASSTAFANAQVQFGDDLTDFIGGRPGFILRWHFAGIDVFHHLRPKVSVDTGLEVTRQLIQSQVALFLFGAMATNAMLGEKSLKRFDAMGE